jgi:hypothetical protein
MLSHTILSILTLSSSPNSQLSQSSLLYLLLYSYRYSLNPLINDNFKTRIYTDHILSKSRALSYLYQGCSESSSTRKITFVKRLLSFVLKCLTFSTSLSASSLLGNVPANLRSIICICAFQDLTFRLLPEALNLTAAVLAAVPIICHNALDIHDLKYQAELQ